MPRLELRPELKQYHDRLCAPLTPLLVGMTETGVLADPDFIRAECGRLDALATDLAARHQALYGVSIDETAAQARWLWGTLRLKPLPGKVKHLGARWVPSLDADHLDDLRARHAHNPRIADSLALIASYRRANSLRSKLRGLLRRVEHDGRIHTSLVDRQATGRISSSKPNLQQVARPKTIAGQLFTCRNALIATPGYSLVAMDLAQADVRVLAHAVASFPLSAKRHLRILRERRYDALCRLDPKFRELYGEIEPHRNPQYRRPKRQATTPQVRPRSGQRPGTGIPG